MLYQHKDGPSHQDVPPIKLVALSGTLCPLTAHGVCVSEGSGSPQHVQLMDLWSNWQKRRVFTGEAQTGPLSWQDLDAGRTWFFSG